MTSAQAGLHTSGAAIGLDMPAPTMSPQLMAEPDHKHI